MVVKKIYNWKVEDGYTLLETLVAMALFVSVLIPLWMTVNNFMLSNSIERKKIAFTLAQSELNRTIAYRTFKEETNHTENGYIIGRKIVNEENIVEIQVSVRWKKKPETVLITLNKSVLRYQ